MHGMLGTRPLDSSHFFLTIHERVSAKTKTKKSKIGNVRTASKRSTRNALAFLLFFSMQPELLAMHVRYQRDFQEEEIALRLPLSQRIKHWLESKSRQYDAASRPYIDSVCDSPRWIKICQFLGSIGKMVDGCQSFKKGLSFHHWPSSLPEEKGRRRKFVCFVVMQLTAQFLPIIWSVIDYNFLRHDPFDLSSYDLCHSKPDGTVQCCTVHDNLLITCCRFDAMRKIIACGDIRNVEPENPLDNPIYAVYDNVSLVNRYFEENKLNATLYKFCLDHWQAIIHEVRGLRAMIRAHQRTGSPIDIENTPFEISKFPNNETIAPNLKNLVALSARILQAPMPQLCILNMLSTSAQSRDLGKTICLSIGIFKKSDFLLTAYWCNWARNGARKTVSHLSVIWSCFRAFLFDKTGAVARFLLSCSWVASRLRN